MREETVTIKILEWLESKGWEIISFDFPQSGTGTLLHPNSASRTTKNKGGVIPDIFAVKGENAVFFENKDRFVDSDFNKLQTIKEEGNFSEALDRLLEGTSAETVNFGVGIPDAVNASRYIGIFRMVDFVLSVGVEGGVTVVHDSNGLFSD